MTPLGRMAVRSLPWALAESAGLAGFLFITAVLLARLVGPTEFGLATLALGIVYLLNLAVEALFHDAIIQREDLKQSHIDTAMWSSMLVGAVLAAAVWILAPYVAEIFDARAVGTLTTWASLALLLSGANGVLTASCRRHMQFKSIAVRTISSRVAGGIAALAIAYAGYGAWSLVAQFLIITLVGTAQLWWMADRRPGFEVSAARLRELSGFAIASFLTRITLTANVRVFTILLGYFLGPTALGYFGFAVKLVDALWEALMTAVYNVTFVLFSRIQHERDKLRDAFREATRLTAVVIVPVFAAVGVCADLVVRMSLGETWFAAVPIIQMLSAASILVALRYFAPVVYRAVGRPHLHLLSTTGGMLYCILGLLLFGRHGLIEASVIWTTSVLLNVPLSILLIRRILGLGVREQFAGLGAPLASAVIMILGLGVARYTLTSGWAPLSELAFLGGLGIALYGAALYIMAPQLFTRIIALAGELRAASKPQNPSAMPRAK